MSWWGVAGTDQLVVPGWRCLLVFPSWGLPAGVFRLLIVGWRQSCWLLIIGWRLVLPLDGSRLLVGGCFPR